jgi:RNA polymerase sigma-70 factor (ECF subfamily)
MAAYCDGDAGAFDQLYARVAPRLLGYLIGLIGDRPTAEDLLQQTFLKLHEARDVYVRGADPVPWLYTIAHRTCLDEVRRRGRAKVSVTKDGTLPDPGAVAEPEGDGAPGRSSATALAALAQLPANQREALVLTKLHGHSVAQAAQIAGTSPGAIKLRAHRAYARLRSLLKGEAP